MKKSAEDDITVEASDIQPSMPLKVAMTVGSLVAGRIVGRIAQPMVRRIAIRYGMPEATLVRIVSVLTPLLVTLAVQTYHRHRTADEVSDR